MRCTLLLLATCAACGFDGGGGGGTPDGPPPGEDELVLDSSAKLADHAEHVDTFVTAFNTVEPIASLTGKLLVDIDDGAGPFGTWAMRPPRSSLVNVGLMAPPFIAGQIPPGATGNNYIMWFSGEIWFEAGSQKLTLGVATNATAFADILKSDGSPLVSCNEAAECVFSTPSAGWYPLHMGWKRPSNAPNHVFELRSATGVGLPAPVSANRLRVRTHTAELAGWRLEGYEAPRSTNHVLNAVALNYKDPFAMTWSPSLLGLGNGSPGYRNAGQVRILKTGNYDFNVTAADEAAYRLWIDGEWVTDPLRWDPQPGTVRQETRSRELTAGWHDVILEGYEDLGTGNMLQLALAESGKTASAPPAAQVRPVVSATPAFTTGANLTDVELIKAVAVPQTVSVAPVAVNPPEISAVDVWLRLQPKVWAGFVVTLRPPGVLSPGITLNVDLSDRVDDMPGDIHASLTKAQLGNATVAGNWIVEVTHPNAGGNLTSVNALSSARINVHYKGGPTVGNPTKVIAEEGRYTRMVSLDKAHELRNLLTTATVPAGTTITARAQVCQDAAGASCGEVLSGEELAAMKPTAQHVKLVVAFESDGFAVPMLEKLTLRYQK